MSWTQGIQERDTIEPRILALYDRLGEKRGFGKLHYICWDATAPHILNLDYGDNALRIDFSKL
jgi:hypothetical protein